MFKVAYVDEGTEGSGEVVKRCSKNPMIPGLGGKSSP
jgi:hypothetical protein